MSRQPLAISGAGMVTGVGLDAPSSCAAIRSAIDNFQETRFMDSGGEWIQGCEVPLEQPWRGTTKLAKMLAQALCECADSDPDVNLDQVPVIICLAEKERPGRVENLGNRVFFEVQQELGVKFDSHSTLVDHGRVGGMVAMLQARKMIYEQDVDKVIIAGVDSLLSAPALSAYEERERLLTSRNSNGFIPGEAAAAVLVSKPKAVPEPQLLCMGLGFGLEKATIDSELHLRADGMVQAFRGALDEAGCTLGDLDFRITDVSGEQYWFKEATLALSRTLRKHKEGFDIWHPADCIGEAGAAIGPVIFNIAITATNKAYAPGNNIICHFSNDDGKRAAAVLAFCPVRAS